VAAELGALQVVFASPPDREWLVAEIWHGNDYLAEVNQDGDQLEVEIAPREDGQPWRVSLADLSAALSVIDARLIKGRGTDVE
jgi:hypothetical protein